jgi:hypothetical protein
MNSYLLAIFLFLTAVCEHSAFAQTITRVGGAGAKQTVPGAGGGPPAGRQYMLGINGLLLKNSASQKEEDLHGGTTILSQTNLQINFTEWLFGVGVIYQDDKLGEFQNNKGVALKAEFTWLGYYFDIAYGNSSQSFVNRAVKSRSGTQMAFSTGFRVPAVFEFVYFDAGIRQRTSTYTKQDGVNVKNPLKEVVTTPYIGFGITL